MDLQMLFLALWGLVRTPVHEASVFLNDPIFVLVASAALVLIVSWIFREQKRIVFVAFTLAIALVLGFGFKTFLQEPRPCVDTPGKINCPLDFSLPSLHALLAFTLAILAVGNRSFAIYLIYALFIAFSRVYLGVHTVPQVAAGLALAFFACVIAEIAWKKMNWEMPSGVLLRHDALRLRK